MELISFRGASPLEIPDGLELSATPTRVEMADGRSVWLRTIRLAPGEDPEAIWEGLRRLADVSGTALARPLAARLDSGVAIVAEVVPDGVSLRVLRRQVPLTFDQAAMVADGLLAAVAALEARQARHRAIGPDTVFIGAADGRVHLVAPDLGPDATQSGSDLECAGALALELLHGISDHSRRTVPPAAQARLLELVDPEGLRGRRAASVVALWRQVLRGHMGSSGRVRVRRQLQALATRLGQQRAAARRTAVPATPVAESALSEIGRSTVAAAPVTSAAAATEPPVLRPGPSVEDVTRPAGPGGRRSHRRLTWTSFPRAHGTGRSWLAAVALIVVLLAAGGTTLALRGGIPRPPIPGSRTARPTPYRSLSPSPSPTAPTNPTPKASAKPNPTPAPLREIPLLGPQSSPPITKVELSASCPPTGSGACTFTVKATLANHQADILGWQVDLVNRCTGSVTEVASGQIPAPASYTYVEAQPQVNLSSTTPVGLVALARAPDPAASAPLLITPPGSSCPG